MKTKYPLLFLLVCMIMNVRLEAMPPMDRGKLPLDEKTAQEDSNAELRKKTDPNKSSESNVFQKKRGNIDEIQETTASSSQEASSVSRRSLNSSCFQRLLACCRRSSSQSNEYHAVSSSASEPATSIAQEVAQGVQAVGSSSVRAAAQGIKLSQLPQEAAAAALAGAHQGVLDGIQQESQEAAEAVTRSCLRAIRQRIASCFQSMWNACCSRDDTGVNEETHQKNQPLNKSASQQNVTAFITPSAPPFVPTQDQEEEKQSSRTPSPMIPTPAVPEPAIQVVIPDEILTPQALSQREDYLRRQGEVRLLISEAEAKTRETTIALNALESSLGANLQQTQQLLEQFTEQATLTMGRWNQVVAAYRAMGELPSSFSNEERTQWGANGEQAKRELEKWKREREKYFSSPSQEERSCFPNVAVAQFDEMILSAQRKVRVKILTTNFKYPLIRVEKWIDRSTLSALDERCVAADRLLITLNNGVGSNVFLQNLQNLFPEAALTLTQDSIGSSSYTLQFQPHPSQTSLPLNFFTRLEETIEAYEKPDKGSQVSVSGPILLSLEVPRAF